MDTLPRELRHVIASRLSVPDLLSLRRASAAWRRDVERLPVWEGYMGPVYAARSASLATMLYCTSWGRTVVEDLARLLLFGQFHLWFARLAWFWPNNAPSRPATATTYALNMEVLQRRRTLARVLRASALDAAAFQKAHNLWSARLAIAWAFFCVQLASYAVVLLIARSRWPGASPLTAREAVVQCVALSAISTMLAWAAWTTVPQFGLGALGAAVSGCVVALCTSITVFVAAKTGLFTALYPVLESEHIFCISLSPLVAGLLQYIPAAMLCDPGVALAYDFVDVLVKSVLVSLVCYPALAIAAMGHDARVLCAVDSEAVWRFRATQCERLCEKLLVPDD